jgi:hypothetical protein
MPDHWILPNDDKSKALPPIPKVEYKAPAASAPAAATPESEAASAPATATTSDANKQP